MLPDDNPWWADAVVYEVYPRSFADSDGDGIGDLNGLASRLPYLSGLGVDAIWLTPFYPSPLVDGGYDVSDYRDVDPRLGTLAGFDALIARAREHGIRVIIDLVPNHCSAAHPLFQAALAARPGSPEREMFIFSDGRGPGGELPPSNWRMQPRMCYICMRYGRNLRLCCNARADLIWRKPAICSCRRDAGSTCLGMSNLTYLHTERRLSKINLLPQRPMLT